MHVELYPVPVDVTAVAKGFVRLNWLAPCRVGLPVREHLRILVNGGLQRVDGGDASRTLTEFLRGSLRLTGTKSACGAGDCGACTVLVGRPGPERYRYRALNSCIQFLFQLDGAHVITIEGLVSRGYTTVSRALAEGHGVQCGFCTPGIVMAVIAADEDAAPHSPASKPAATRLALGGNLCRCTGYMQILQALGVARKPHVSLERLFPSKDLREALGVATPHPVMVPGEHGNVVLLPHTVSQALAYLADYPEATIVSGATDVGTRGDLERLSGAILYLGRVGELRDISVDAHAASVGGAVSLAEFGAVLGKVTPAVTTLVERFGSPQIRNCATVAGNLASGSPVADLLPLLLASETTIELVSRSGTRTMLVEEFLRADGSTARAAGEIIRRILVPRFERGSDCRLYKVSKRRHVDIAAVTAAIVTHTANGTIRRARVAVGGVGPTVIRLRDAEAALERQPYALSTFVQAGQVAARGVDPRDDLRGSADYRRRLVANLFQQYYWEGSGNVRAGSPSD